MASRFVVISNEFGQPPRVAVNGEVFKDKADALAFADRLNGSAAGTAGERFTVHPIGRIVRNGDRIINAEKGTTADD